ncbi:MAG: hypothetical protein V7642_746 [Burkholderiales bacterium]|jgi:hypothetical protein
MKIFPAHASFLLIAAALHTLNGCTPLSPRLDSTFGNSLNALKAYQTIDPSASANTANPMMDGAAAREASERYTKSYSAPTPHANVFTIGVSGGAR